ncbi:MAG: 50S ribosomal protein L15 [Candidatus Heimdallarchaeota archaeon]|nr:50S ribosomal protein L15 [Candidatus Heimdallarchaeota archaeon]
MVVRRTKKVRRQRGGRSHGWGVVRDHKGAGMRGGRGGAGLTQHKWIQTVILAKLEGRKPLGRYGFKRPQQFAKKYGTLNVSHLDQSIDTLVKNGQAKLTGKIYTIDLKELGITKLLAQGDISRKMKVSVDRATDRAVSKIEAAGGSVALLAK